MSDEAHRIWTQRIDNKLIAEYSDGDYLIDHDDWGLILEPPQMRALLKFTRNAATGDETELGENALTGELSVRYQNDTYSFTGEDLYSDPSVSADEMDAIQTLLS